MCMPNSEVPALGTVGMEGAQCSHGPHLTAMTGWLEARNIGWLHSSPTIWDCADSRSHITILLLTYQLTLEPCASRRSSWCRTCPGRAAGRLSAKAAQSHEGQAVLCSLAIPSPCCPCAVCHAHRSSSPASSGSCSTGSGTPPAQGGHCHLSVEQRVKEKTASKGGGIKAKL